MLEDGAGATVGDEQADLLVQTAAQGDDPLLAALAVANKQLVLLRIKIPQVELEALRDTQAKLDRTLDEQAMLQAHPNNAYTSAGV